VAIASVTVSVLPVILISGQSTMCPGTSQTLSATGANTYTWMASSVNPVYVVTPSVSSTYTLTGTAANGCTNNAQITISLAPQPGVSITGSTAVCAGSAFTLNAAGSAGTFTWSNGLTGTPVTFTLPAGTVISMTGTAANGCTGSASLSLTVNALPQVMAHAGSTAVCAGSQVTLFGSGALTYSWTGGVLNNTAFSPSATAGYTVTGTDQNGCRNTSSMTVFVHDLPLVTITGGSADTICDGDEIILNAGGASSYLWNTGESTPSLAVVPGFTNGYTVTGTDTNGCTGHAYFTQGVKECVGLREQTTEARWRIYPNPTSGAFLVELSDIVNEGQIEISNVVGAIVYSEKIQGQVIETDLKGAGKGVYLIKIYSSGRLVLSDKVITTE
jgi:hypothetical protein